MTILAKKTTLNSEIIYLSDDISFSEKDKITMKIFAASAYPNGGGVSMSKNKALKIIEDALTELTEGPIMGANITPTIGFFKNGDDIDWDTSYTLQIIESANELLRIDNFAGYINSIRKFIHTICTQFVQKSVLFHVSGIGGYPDQGDLVNIQSKAEKEIVDTYQKQFKKYGYINTEDLEDMVRNINRDKEIDSREEE